MPILQRLSASLIILRQHQRRNHFEVLLIKRGQNLKFAASNWVFPGGIVDSTADHDPTDDAAGDGGSLSITNEQTLRNCALREAFEETGVVPLKHISSSTAHDTTSTLLVEPSTWNDWRAQVHSNASMWSKFKKECEQNNMTFTTVNSFCCFQTPTFEAKRSNREYVTHFFICELPTNDDNDNYPWETCCVDGDESEKHLWLKPSKALAMHSEGQLPLFPPQLYILERIQQFPTASKAVQSSNWLFKPKKERLPLVFKPQLVSLSDKEKILTLPYDEHFEGEYAGEKGDRHRIAGFTSLGATVIMNDAASKKLMPQSMSNSIV
jgi:8-oxo-dGTP pyrophosphatase MutT (NUDIX family)